jgi:hypothetical protein
VRFRNWITRVRLVETVPDLASAEPKLKPGAFLTPVEEEVYSKITAIENRGRVIPVGEIMVGLGSFDPGSYVNTFVCRINSKLEEEGPKLAKITDLGCIYGMQDHSFAPVQTIRLVRALAYHFDEDVPNAYLGRMLGMTPTYLAVTAHRFSNARLDTAMVRLERHGHTTKLTWV